MVPALVRAKELVVSGPLGTAAIAFFLPFATSALQARFSVPVEFGAAMGTLMVGQLIATAMDLGLRTQIQVDAASRLERTSAVSIACLVTALSSGAALLAVIWPLLQLDFGQSAVLVLAVATTAWGAALLVSLSAGALGAREGYGTLLWAELIRLIATIALIGTSSLSAPLMVGAWLFGRTGAILVTTLRLSSRLERDGAPTGFLAGFRALRHLVGRSYRFALVPVVSLVSARLLDTALLGAFGSAGYAVFISASQIPAAIQRVVDYSRPSLVGWLSHARSSGAPRRLATMALLTTAAVSLVGISLSGVLVPLIYGAQYSSASSVLDLLLIVLPLNIVCYIGNLRLAAVGKGGRASLHSLMTLVLGATGLFTALSLGASLPMTIGGYLLGTAAATPLYFRSLGYSWPRAVLPSAFGITILLLLLNPPQWVVP